MDDTSELERLRRAYETGPEKTFEYVHGYRDRLRRLVAFRLDSRVKKRIDPSDVIQEAYVDILRRVGEYIASPDVPFFIWLRYLTLQKLNQIHEKHIKARSRSVADEFELHAKMIPNATSLAIAAQLVGKLDTPAAAALREERRLLVLEALNAIPETDREVLALRHFEQLQNREVARVLGIEESAASHRYYRALERLKSRLAELGIKGWNTS